MPYFLDGNNLIGHARRTARPSQEDRAALICEVADRLRRTKASAVLFFDGANQRGSSLGALTIHASAGTSADDQIVDEIRRARASIEITVVTADRNLARRARDLGAKAIAPAEFWNRVGGGRTNGGGKPDSPSDVEEWMKYFEDDRNRGR
jgi:predicted RNA-binding protein with PIN domain